MFEFEYINRGYCRYKPGKSLREQTCMVPNKYGVYVCRKNKRDGEVLYIGKSGTIRQDGSYGKQGLKYRLNNKADGGVKREEWLLERFQEDHSLIRIYIEWFELDEKKYLPGYIEGCLYQDFYCEHKCLPKWNKKY